MGMIVNCDEEGPESKEEKLVYLLHNVTIGGIYGVYDSLSALREGVEYWAMTEPLMTFVYEERHLNAHAKRLDRPDGPGLDWAYVAQNPDLSTLRLVTGGLVVPGHRFHGCNLVKIQ